MENLIKVIIKCPNCLNKMPAVKSKDGSLKGNCPVCKATIFSKEHTKETLIRIVKNTNN